MARGLHITDREVRKGNWTNIKGFSLRDKKALVVGFGDIGHNVVNRLLAAKMHVNVCDPYYTIAKNIVGNDDRLSTLFHKKTKKSFVKRKRVRISVYLILK